MVSKPAILTKICDHCNHGKHTAFGTICDRLRAGFCWIWPVYIQFASRSKYSIYISYMYMYISYIYIYSYNQRNYSNSIYHTSKSCGRLCITWRTPRPLKPYYWSNIQVITRSSQMLPKSSLTPHPEDLSKDHKGSRFGSVVIIELCQLLAFTTSTVTCLTMWQETLSQTQGLVQCKLT